MSALVSNKKKSNHVGRATSEMILNPHFASSLAWTSSGKPVVGLTREERRARLDKPTWTATHRGMVGRNQKQ